MLAPTLNPPIGILGGTFNPIHWGHLLPSKTIMTELKLAQLKLIPNRRPPHKQSPGVDGQKRAHMVALACEQMTTQYQCPFTVDRIELERDKPSYTLDTLKILQQRHPNTPLCFLMGLDSLINFHTWYQFEQILTCCHLIVSARPGYQLDPNSHGAQLLNKHQTHNPKDISKQLAGLIYIANIEPINISASEIRSRIANNLAVDDLLPSSVLAYIEQMQLYRAGSRSRRLPPRLGPSQARESRATTVALRSGSAVPAATQ